MQWKWLAVLLCGRSSRDKQGLGGSLKTIYLLPKCTVLKVACLGELVTAEVLPARDVRCCLKLLTQLMAIRNAVSNLQPEGRLRDGRGLSATLQVGKKCKKEDVEQSD